MITPEQPPLPPGLAWEGKAPKPMYLTVPKRGEATVYRSTALWVVHRFPGGWEISRGYGVGETVAEQVADAQRAAEHCLRSRGILTGEQSG